MGDHTYFTVLLLCSIICSFVCPESFGFEPCPDKIQSVCQCFYPFTVRCSQKELKEYPDLTSIQVGIYIKISKFKAKCIININSSFCLNRVQSKNSMSPSMLCKGFHNIWTNLTVLKFLIYRIIKSSFCQAMLFSRRA